MIPEEYKPSTEAWIKLPVELLKRKGISQKAAVLLSIIIDKCKHTQELSASITADELTAKSGMSRRTVCYAIEELRALDLIRTERTGRASVYTLTPGCVELCPRAVRDEHPAEQPPRRQRSKPTPRRAAKSGKDYGALIRQYELEAQRRADAEYANEVARNMESELPGQTSFFDKEVST